MISLSVQSPGTKSKRVVYGLILGLWLVLSYLTFRYRYSPAELLAGFQHKIYSHVESNGEVGSTESSPTSDIANTAPTLALPAAAELELHKYTGIMVSAPPIQSKEPSPPSESIPSLDSDHAAISDGTEGADTIPPPLHKGEVVIITASSGNGGYLGVPGLKAQVYENRRAYAERWGHEFFWADMSSYDYKKIPWNKIPIIKEAHIRYPAAKWFWWLDTDIMIMNITVDIHSLVLSREGMARNLLYDHMIPAIGGGPLGIKTPSEMDPDDVNCLITFDDWGMNTGSYLLRRGNWTDMILDFWTDPLLIEKDWIFFDQDGWVHMYKQHETVRRHTGLVRQTSINGYNKYNLLGAHWKEGDLLAHFPGCGGQKNMTNCRNHWNEYWDMRHPYEEYPWIREQIENGTAPIEYVKKGGFEDT